MAAPDVFDEHLSLKRLTVAYKRSDWRMFEHALMRLAHEIARASPFRDHRAWQAFWRAVEADPELPQALKDRLSESLSQLLTVEVQATIPAASPRPSAPASSGVAILDLWRSPLREEGVRQAFKAHLAGQAGSERLLGWLSGESDELEHLVAKFNAAQTAQAVGLNLQEPAWDALLLAGLHRALPHASAPPLSRLLDDASGLGPLHVLTSDPGRAWERHYGDATWNRHASEPGAAASGSLLPLAGALDWFFCPRCQAEARLAPDAPAVLSLLCPSCGGPCAPLLSPGQAATSWPAPLVTLREQGSALLRESACWVLLSPPSPLLRKATALLDQPLDGKRLLVIDEDDTNLQAWQAWLQARGAGSVVTSRGPADGVLAYLLQGNVVPLTDAEPAAAEGENAADTTATLSDAPPREAHEPAKGQRPEGGSFKKKGRR